MGLRCIEEIRNDISNRKGAVFSVPFFYSFLIINLGKTPVLIVKTK